MYTMYPEHDRLPRLYCTLKTLLILLLIVSWILIKRRHFFGVPESEGFMLLLFIVLLHADFSMVLNWWPTDMNWAVVVCRSYFVPHNFPPGLFWSSAMMSVTFRWRRKGQCRRTCFGSFIPVPPVLVGYRGCRNKRPFSWEIHSFQKFSLLKPGVD